MRKGTIHLDSKGTTPDSVVATNSTGGIIYLPLSGFGTGGGTAGAVLLNPTAGQLINQGAFNFEVNRSGNHTYTGDYLQVLKISEDVLNWGYVDPLNPAGMEYSMLALYPYSGGYQARNGSRFCGWLATADTSSTQYEFYTGNSQMQVTTYNSDNYTVLYWNIGDGRMSYDSFNGRWGFKAEGSGATMGMFEVRPEGLYWNDALIDFSTAGGGTTTPTFTTDKSIQLVSDTLTLVGDVTAPGNSYYYGTDATGVKGFFPVPAGGSSAWGDITGKPTTLSGYGITDAATASHTHAFASLTSKPTTLAGYGITDAATSGHTHAFSSLTAKPTTLAGYGITDAATSGHTHAGLLTTTEKTKFDANVRSKTPVALTDGATTTFNLAAGYTFTWAISAGGKTIDPSNHEDGDNWIIRITGCAGQRLTFGPTTGYAHWIEGEPAQVTAVDLPASGKVLLRGVRIGTDIFWGLAEF